METIDIRQKLHQIIDTIEDKKVEAMYTLFKKEMDIESQRKILIQAERQYYLNGEGESNSWEDVKNMALNKKERNA